MKSLLCILGLVAVATAMVDTNHMYHFHAQSAKHVQASEARYHAADKTALWRAPNYNEKDLPRMFDISIRPACQAATIELVRLYRTCNAFQAGAALFQNQTVPTQNEINAYCGAACKQEFEIYATTTFVQSCSAAEILQIEINDARNTSNPDPFKFFKLLFVLRQPCVKLGTEYCLPTWFELSKTFSAGSQPTAAQLENVCKPCLKAFLVEWVKWASLDQIRQFAFIDLLCTRAPKRDGTRAFCVVEFNEVEAMAEGIPKLSRMCSTRCYQKIIVKTWLAKGDLTPQERANMTTFFKALDIFCAVNARGEYCGVEMSNFETTLAPAAAACSNSLGSNTCSDNCRAAARTFYNSLGCCFASFLNSEKEFNPDKTDGLQMIENFVRGTCGVPTPRPCRKWGKLIAARIVVRNLAFAYYVAYTRVVRAAILADLAMQLGARQNQVVITSDPTQVAPQSDKMGVMAEGGISFSVQISADGNDDPTGVQADFASDLSNGNINLLQTSQMTTLESRPNPALGMSIDTSASTTSLIDDPDNSATGSKLSIFAVLAAIIVGLALRA